jgi:hypothetical protein
MPTFSIAILGLFDGRLALSAGLLPILEIPLPRHCFSAALLAALAWESSYSCMATNPSGVLRLTWKPRMTIQAKQIALVGTAC